MTNSSSNLDSSNVARRAAYGTLATLVLRFLSFACTQWTFRHVDPSTLGQASIQLELLHATIIFVSREGFRLALTRTDEMHWNVAWLTVPLATAVSLTALAWHLLYPYREPSSTSEDYRIAGILYCLAAALEGWAEPAVLLALRQMNVALKASAEGVATVGKTVALVVFLRLLPENRPISAFGSAQIVYSLLYAITIIRAVGNQIDFPKWSNGWHRPTCYMTLMFTLQGFLKHLLTEGDRIVLSTLAGSYDQGVYAMGSAYGGLAARILLQPLEENGRLLWSRQAAASGKDDKVNRNADPLLLSYTVLVKLVLYIGLVFSCLAVNYTGILLSLLAGRRWGENPEAANVLGAFCVYTAFLAWNGTTEAFVYAVASTATDLGRLGLAHTVVGIVFGLVAPLAVSHYGTVGLVAANCLAMSCRSVYSLQFASSFFRKRWDAPGRVTIHLLQRMFPHPAVLGCFVASFAATRVSRGRFVVQTEEVLPATGIWFHCAAQHIGIGCVSGVVVLSVAYVVERSFRASLRTVWKGKQE